MDRRAVKSAGQELEGVARVDDLRACNESAIAVLLCSNGRRNRVHTRAFSMCFTHFQEPSFARICSAATGWLYRMVIVPKSGPRLPLIDGVGVTVVKRRTGVALQPDVVCFELLFFRSGIAEHFAL